MNCYQYYSGVSGLKKVISLANYGDILSEMS